MLCFQNLHLAHPPSCYTFLVRFSSQGSQINTPLVYCKKLFLSILLKAHFPPHIIQLWNTHFSCVDFIPATHKLFWSNWVTFVNIPVTFINTNHFQSTETEEYFYMGGGGSYPVSQQHTEVGKKESLKRKAEFSVWTTCKQLQVTGKHCRPPAEAATGHRQVLPSVLRQGALHRLLSGLYQNTL